MRQKSLPAKKILSSGCFLFALPLFFALLHLASADYSLMFNDNLLWFSYSYYAIQSIATGEIPLRDPYLYIDLFRTGFGAPFYWPQVFFHFFAAVFCANNIEWIRMLWSGLHILHICIPSIAMYLLLKFLRLRGAGCLFGAIVYGWSLNAIILGGIYTAHQRAVHMSVIPLAWLLTVYATDQKKYYLNLLAGVLIGWAMLSGGLQPSMYIVPFLMLYTFFNVIKNEKTYGLLKAFFASFLIIAGILATIFPLLITAFDIFPFLKRAYVDAHDVTALFSLGDFFAGLIAPFFQWSRNTPFPWESARYMGFATIFLFFIGVFSIFGQKDSVRRREYAWFMLILVFFLIVCAGYAFLPKKLVQAILIGKGISRYPFRAWPLVVFAVSYFAARGLDDILANRGTASKKNLFSFIFISMAGFTLFVFIVFFAEPVYPDPLMQRFHSALVVAGIIALLLTCRRVLPGRIIVGILILDLGLAGFFYCKHRFVLMEHEQINWYQDAMLRTKDQHWISKLPRTGIPYRVKVFAQGEGRGGIVGKTPGYLYHKLRDPFGYGGSVALYHVHRHFNDWEPGHPIFDILSVKYFFIGPERLKEQSASQTKGILVKNDKSMPFISMARSIRLFPSSEALAEAVKKGDKDIYSHVYINRQMLDDNDPIILFAGKTAPEHLSTKIYNPAIGSRTVEFEVDVKEKEVLILLSEPWLPPWRATIDGRPTRIYPAYGIIQAISVPGGVHKIRFEYTYPYYLVIMSLAFQIFIFLLIFRFTKKPQGT